MEQSAVEPIIKRLDQIERQHRLFWSILAATLMVSMTVIVTILVREPPSSNGRYQLAVTGPVGNWDGQITRFDTRTGAIQVFVASHIFPHMQRTIGFDKKIELVEVSSLAATATEERK